MGVDPHAHFDSLRPGVLSAWALRDAAEISAHNQAGNWTYDRNADAARSTMSGATISYGTAQQINLPFARAIDSLADDFISWQCEVRYGAAWVGDLGALTTHKAIRLDDAAKLYAGGIGDERLHELQMRYSVTDGTAVAVPTLRSYVCTNLPNANQDPLRDTASRPINWQPGGSRYYLSTSTGVAASDHMQVGKPFVVLPDTWIRITYVWSKATGLVTLTMADMRYQAVKVIEYLSSRTTGRTCADTLRLQFNSSQVAPPNMTTGHDIWVRNVLVDNKPIPAGTVWPVPRVTASVIDTNGIVAEARIAASDLTTGKAISMRLEASRDGVEWHTDQSLVWRGPSTEYPIIVPSKTTRGWRYRVIVESDEPVDVVAETRG